MSTPKKVLEAAAKADAILAEMDNEQEAINARDAALPAESEQAVVPVETPAPAVQAPVVVEPVAQAPVVPPVVTPTNLDQPWIQPVKATTIEELGKQYDELVHKHSVLCGKYGAETKRYKSRISELEGDVQLLNEQVTRYRNTAATPAPIATTTQQESDVLTDEEKSKFDPETINLVKKVGKAEAERLMKKIADEGLERVAELEKSLRQDRFNRFIDDIGKAIPEFSAIDASDDFNDRWLKLRERFSGRTYGELLQSAASNFDVSRACEIINAYKASITPEGIIRPVPPSLNSQIAPPKNMTVSATGGKKPTFTIGQYKNTYAAIARGEYSPKRAAELKAELDAAVDDDRITP